MRPRVSSRQGRSILRRLVGRKSSASATILGENKRDEVLTPKKNSHKSSFRRGQNLLNKNGSTRTSAGADGDSNSVGAASHRSSSLVTGSMPIVVKPRVTQENFVDALAAVMSGQIELGADDDDDDERHSLSSVSTVSSHVKLLKNNNSDEASESEKGKATTLGVGQLFFYLEQQKLAKQPSTPENVAKSKRKASDAVLALQAEPQNASIDDDDSIFDSSESENSDDSRFNFRALAEEKAKEADREGLFELGEAMYRRGEKLLAQGEIEEAREALERAQTFQKHSLELIVKRMATSIHKQGRQHCDRGDKFLAIILLGIAELLKYSPTADHLKLGTQIHRGYKKTCPQQREFLETNAHVRHCMKSIEKESFPMARTLQAYAKCFSESANRSMLVKA